MSTTLTPVTSFGDWCAKREDLAGFVSSDYPAGAKVRQFMAMADAAPGKPMIVGCSADSAMQVYVSAAAKLRGVPGIVYVPARTKETAATRYARDMGAEVDTVWPGYLSFVRAAAKKRAAEIGGVVRWSPQLAVSDTAAQVGNIPSDVVRVVVPVGTGAIAAGILAGLAEAGRQNVVVTGIAVSGMADAMEIVRNAGKATGSTLPHFEMINCGIPYKKPVAARLPDGTPLDPFYAAKALRFVQPGDCFWLSGVRPVAAFPIMKGRAG